MTHVFKVHELEKVQIAADMPEWRERVIKVDGDRGTAAIYAWKTGHKPNTAEDMPRVLVAPRPRKNWPDAFSAVNGLLVVTKRAKDVIEALDPDIHQFFPLTLQTKRGIDIEGPWFAMNVHVKQDSVVLERSRVQMSKRAPDRLNGFHSNSKPKDVVVDPARQGELNLWREQRFVGSLLGSDRLAAEFKARGIKFFPSFRATDLTDATAKLRSR